MISDLVRKLPLLAALFVVGCGKDNSGPSAVATTVAVVQASGQTATVGAVVAPGLTFSVKDQNGNAMAGISITITVTAGGGSIVSPPTTTTAGETSVGVWTLGTLVGVNTLTIKAGSLTAITFSITTVAGPPSQITIVSGGSQSAPAGTALQAISIKVADQFGNGIASRPVTIAVSSGGGTVSPASGTTDASGQINGINWTLGKSALPQSLSAVSGSIVSSIPATVQTSYALEVRYFGGDPSSEVQQAFTNAAARIRGAITATLGLVPFASINLNAGSTNCGVPVTLNESVRDLLIFAQIHTIDGPGKILGSAGPCLVRSTSRLSIIGVMEFDSEDLSTLATTGRLEAVILHEMTHVVGFGTLWDEKTPPLLSGAGTPDPRFIGTNTISACSGAGGTSLCAGGVAVENCVGLTQCGSGTQDSHWREGTATLAGFHTELMTGFVEKTGTFMSFSNITLQSLGDIGYTVNASSADAYTVASPTIRALLRSAEPVSTTQWERVRRPTATVSSSGSVKPIVSQ